MGSIFFGASGFVGNTPWPQIAAGAIWLPLVFLFYLRSLRGERPAFHAAIAGGFLALSFLSGHHAVPTFAALAIVAIGISQFAFLPTAITIGAPPDLAHSRRRPLGAVQILPAIEYARYAVRWVNAANPVGWGGIIPYPVHQMLGWSANELLFAIVPGGAVTSIVSPFIGIVPLTLAGVALLASPRRRGTGLLAGVALGGLLFSLARANPFHGVLYALVPGLEKARAPIMAMAIADVALAALAAFGVEALLAMAVPALRRVAVAVAAVAAFLFVVSVYPPSILQDVPHGAERAGAIAVVAALLGVLLWAWQRATLKPLALVAGVLVLSLIEIGEQAPPTITCMLKTRRRSCVPASTAARPILHISAPANPLLAFPRA